MLENLMNNIGITGVGMNLKSQMYYSISDIKERL